MHHATARKAVSAGSRRTLTQDLFIKKGSEGKKSKESAITRMINHFPVYRYIHIDCYNDMLSDS